MKFLLTGATGFVGPALVRRLKERKDTARVVTRDPVAAAQALGQDVDAVALDAPPAKLFEGVDVVVNLMGEPIFGRRWSAEQKVRLRNSRVEGTKRLVDAMRALPADKRPKALISASAIGYYGARGNEELGEDGPIGVGFLADVCREWEDAARAAETLGVRTAIVRVGVVLGPGGGALERMLPIFRLGGGGPIGSGAHWFSWIHRDDLAGLILHCADRPEVRGPVNGTAPNPVTNAAFTKALAKAVRRPAFFPVPPFMLKLVFGESAEILTTGQRVLPKAALASGYAFKYPDVDAALAAILPLCP
jgi:uncharacterized protein (TIGR01777 family)